MLEIEKNNTFWSEQSIPDEFLNENSSFLNFSLGEHHVPRNTELNIPYTIMEGLVAFVAVIGNGLVIIVFFRERRLRRRTNYYIISLALADFLVGLIGIPFAVLVSILIINLNSFLIFDTFLHRLISAYQRTHMHVYLLFPH